MPKVSIIIPNYNHALYLPKRIDSVLHQTFQDSEIILLDDASTDNSREILSSYASDPRIRCIFNDTNSGCVFRQWNLGFRESRSEYVWIAESDDYADPKFLETLVDKLDQHPGVGVAYCQSQAVDENDNHLFVVEQEWWSKRIDPDHWRDDFVNDGRDECRRFMIYACTIPNASAALIRRSVVEEIGYADETLRLAGDYVFWVRMLLASDVAFHAKPLNYWRTHSNTVRAASASDGSSILETYRVAKMIIDATSVDESDIEKSCSARFQAWMWSSKTNRFSRTRNAEIRKVACGIDPRLNQRLVVYPVQSFMAETRNYLGKAKRSLLAHLKVQSQK